MMSDLTQILYLGLITKHQLSSYLLVTKSACMQKNFMSINVCFWLSASLIREGGIRLEIHGKNNEINSWNFCSVIHLIAGLSSKSTQKALSSLSKNEIYKTWAHFPFSDLLCYFYILLSLPFNRTTLILYSAIYQLSDFR